MAAMVLRSTASDAPPQPEIKGATRKSKMTKRNDIRRSPGVGRGLRGGMEARGHATGIDAPKAGNSKAGKRGQRKGAGEDGLQVIRIRGYRSYQLNANQNAVKNYLGNIGGGVSGAEGFRGTGPQH